MIISLNNEMVSIDTHNENRTQKKRGVFTYSGMYILAITKLFKHSNIWITCRTDNTKKDMLETKTIRTAIYCSADSYKSVCFD
jgi:hypothetical protein